MQFQDCFSLDQIMLLGVEAVYWFTCTTIAKCVCCAWNEQIFTVWCTKSTAMVIFQTSRLWLVLGIAVHRHLNYYKKKNIIILILNSLSNNYSFNSGQRWSVKVMMLKYIISLSFSQVGYAKSKHSRLNSNQWASQIN